MSLDGSVNLLLKFDQVDAELTHSAQLAQVVDLLSLSIADGLAFGTGAGQINAFWHDTRTLDGGGPGSSETLDLYDSLIDGASGETITFTEIKLFFVRCNSPIDNIKMTFDIVDGWKTLFDSTVILRLGDVFLWYNFGLSGAGIGAGNSDVTFLNTGVETGTYDIIVVGVGTRA